MKYKIHWQTKIGIGSTFYRGMETVESDLDQEEAEEIAISRIWSKGFKDYPRSHIQITKTEVRS